MVAKFSVTNTITTGCAKGLASRLFNSSLSVLQQSVHMASGLGFAAILLTGCNEKNGDASPSVAPAEKSPAVVASTVSEQQRLLDYLEAMDRENLARSPLFATYRGEKLGYDSWSDLSEAKADADLALHKRRLAELKAFDTSKLNTSAQLSLKIAMLAAEKAIASDEFRHNTYIMQQFRAWHTQVPSVLINMHRVANEEDLQAYIARLEKTEALFNQVIEQMRIREQAGVFPPRWSYPQMISTAENVLVGRPFQKEGQQDSTLLADFRAKLETLQLAPEQAAKYLQQAEANLKNRVEPAYLALIKELKKQAAIAPEGDGVWRLPKGAAYYSHLLRNYTTTKLSAEDIHQLGLSNVARIHGEMKAIMQQVKFQGDLQAFFAFMREDPQFYFPETPEGKAAYLAEAKSLIDTIEQRLPEYFGILPKAELNIKAVEAFREKSAGKAFYQAPSADGSRPGIYYANLYKMADMPKYQMAALAYHEGIPGHHMQRAITVELQDIPKFQRYVSFTAFTEGWGLYTEYLPKEMGFYQNPYADFGRLAMELWRACRLVVDTGIHAKKWSREQAIQYLQDNTPNPAGDTIKAIERYIVYPGQATAYLIGKIKILELRENAKAQLGDKFDIRSFHDEVLRYGPVPLSLLEENIQRWVQQRLIN